MRNGKPMRICFIGGGNIASALIGALSSSDSRTRPVDDPGDSHDVVMEVIDPSSDARSRLEREHGVRTFATAGEAAAREAVLRADILVLAVKPQLLEKALAPVAAALGTVNERHEGRRSDQYEDRDGDRLLVSVLAGTPLARLEALLPGVAVVRAMPNTPALLGAGISGLCAGAGCTPRQRELAADLLRGAGEVVWVEDEAQMHTVTALSGSGPAYFFLLIEALRDAGQAQGLEAAVAERLAVQTAHGAGLMARRGDLAVDELRRRVTSPGGTTEAGIEAFESGGLGKLVAAAVAAAAQRSRELAGETSEDQQP